MSVDYSLIVKRKKDNKKIAEFSCNSLKCLIDSEYKNIIHCDSISYNGSKATFTPSELENMSELIFKDIKERFNTIKNNQLLICAAKSKEVADDYKESNSINEQYIDEELKWQYNACCSILGKIRCVTEDLYKKNTPAYQYNAKDLDGVDSIWCDDVYCEIEASY